LFASAAVLLLRLRGVPARYVTGFRGGEWNSVGDYVAVRDDRAHAWAEAFLPDRGWIRVDATPPGPPLARGGHISEVMDALDDFGHLTERYAAARFGGHDPDENVVAELAAKLAIRTASPSHTGTPPGAPRA